MCGPAPTIWNTHHPWRSSPYASGHGARCVGVTASAARTAATASSTCTCLARRSGGAASGPSAPPRPPGPATTSPKRRQNPKKGRTRANCSADSSARKAASSRTFAGSVTSGNGCQDSDTRQGTG